MKIILVSFISIILLCSCFTQSKQENIGPQQAANSILEKLQAVEKSLGTHKEKAIIYHEIVRNPENNKLKVDGYIVGVEKGPRKRVSHDSDIFYTTYMNNLCNSLQEQQELREGWTRVSPKKYCYDPTRQRERDFVLQTAWDGNNLSNTMLEGVGWNGHTNEKRHFVSHIFSYSKTTKDSSELQVGQEYNLYTFLMNESPPYYSNGYPGAFQQGMDVLGQLHQNIETRLKTEGYTHIFFCSMGWHSDQTKSIQYFNDLMELISEQATLWNDGDAVFKPLVVGITWPANWKGNAAKELASYWNKADDADEIGSTIGALLLDQILLAANAVNLPKKPKVVVLSHSFGVRLTSSALFFRDLVVEDRSIPRANVDLYFGIEGAVSSNRFLDSQGEEGQPYKLEPFGNTTFVYTWSKHDKANPLTKNFSFLSGAPHIGGKPGYKNLMKAYKEYKPDDQANLAKIRIQKVSLTQETPRILTFTDENDLKDSAGKQNLLYLDVSEFVIESPGCCQGGAHNDIYNKEVGAMLYNLIREYAK